MKLTGLLRSKAEHAKEIINIRSCYSNVCENYFVKKKHKSMNKNKKTDTIKTFWWFNLV